MTKVVPSGLIAIGGQPGRMHHGFYADWADAATIGWCRSLPLLINVLPLEPKMTDVTGSACPANMTSIAPVFNSHSLTVLSLLTLAIVSPSGLIATELTHSVCPCKTLGSAWLIKSQTRIVRLAIPLTMVL